VLTGNPAHSSSCKHVIRQTEQRADEPLRPIGDIEAIFRRHFRPTLRQAGNPASMLSGIHENRHMRLPACQQTCPLRSSLASPHVCPQACFHVCWTAGRQECMKASGPVCLCARVHVRRVASEPESQPARLPAGWNAAKLDCTLASLRRHSVNGQTSRPECRQT
jgi:hypothetical protein